MSVIIENNIIVFEDSYTLDHVITGQKEDDLELLYQASLSNLELEIICNGWEENEALKNMKCSIPLNETVKEIKEEYSNFRELVECLFKYIDNEDVFPYLEE